MTKASLTAAYDAEVFRQRGHRLVDQLADYLSRAVRSEMPVVEPVTPRDALDRWNTPFTSSGGADFHALVDRVIEQSPHQHHPHYVGHQVSPPLPLAALSELAAAVLNNGMAAFEAGPVSTSMERHVIAWMGLQLGFDGACEGILTSGGTLGNLTALLAARQLRAGYDVWSEGSTDDAKLAVLVSDQAHYSISRAVQVMGWGAPGAIAVETDASFRMQTDALERALAKAKSAGRRVVAVVANAGSTPTGAIDPLESVADFCERHGLWFHVDGAHGAATVLSERYRHLAKGIARADSVVWDAHKMLAMPSLVTAVLFRDGKTSYESFAQRASYLFAPGDPREQWFNLGLRTMECTKRMMSLKLYAVLQVLGTSVFDDYVTSAWDLARRFAAMLREEDRFEVPVDPTCNIVCFRYVPDGAGEGLDALQDAIRARVIGTGRFFLTRTALRGSVYLRTTLMNPFTTEPELKELVALVRDAASAGR